MWSAYFFKRKRPHPSKLTYACLPSLCSFAARCLSQLNLYAFEEVQYFLFGYYLQPRCAVMLIRHP